MSDDVMMSESLHGVVDMDEHPLTNNVMTLTLAYEDKRVLVAVLTHCRLDLDGKSEFEFEITCDPQIATDEITSAYGSNPRVMLIEIDRGNTNLVQIQDVFTITAVYMNGFSSVSSQVNLGLKLKKLTPSVL